MSSRVLSVIFSFFRAIYFTLFVLFLSSCGGSGNEATPIQTPPVAELSVLSHVPLIAQVDVDKNSFIEVKFSTEITTHHTYLQVVLPENNITITGNLVNQADSLQFTPTQPLHNNKTYQVILEYGASPTDKKEYSWTFTTIADAELNVKQTFPADNESNIDINTPITIELSREIHSSNVVFTLTKLGLDDLIQGKLTVNEKQITFIPSTPLDYSSEYVVNIASKPASQDTLDSFQFSFETMVSQQREVGSFHPEILKYGKTQFSISPIESVTADMLTKVSFGIPFPKDYINSPKEFRILDENNNEVAIAVQENMTWQNINEHGTSIRSVLVQLELEFPANEFGLPLARELTLEWGVNRSIEDLTMEPVRSVWVLVDDDEYPASDAVYEPQAYAIFQPSWYGDCVIKTRLLPLNSHPDFSAYDIAFNLFGDTAINHVDPRVIEGNLIPHRESYAAWLFDRAMTIYQLAFRTGKFKYLRAAHRAAQFYQQHINDGGYFSLKPSDDMKYSYGEGLVSNYILLGDERIPDKIKSMISAWDSFDSEYKLTTNFWTERHAAFQLKGYVTAYEITGDILYKQKANITFQNILKMQTEPVDGVPKTGALMHTSASHGEGGQQFIASPWMSVLLIDAVERYGIHIESNNVADFVMKLADFFQQDGVGLYEWKGYQEKDSFFVPYYLAGLDLTEKEHGGVGAKDLEHGIDVIKIFSSAYFYSCSLRQCNESYLRTISRLYHTAFIQNIPSWIRASAPSDVLSSYRLSPPRKFNWWFNTTSNSDFLLGNKTSLPIYKKAAPLLSLTQENIDLESFKPGDEIEFKFKLKNLGNTTAKNIVIKASTPMKSPEGLLEVISINQSGVNKTGEIIWYVETLAANEELANFSFTVLVKNLPALQRKNRPIGNILSFAEASYCDEGDSLDDCLPWVNLWDNGEQTFKVQSNWLSISPIAPNSPPSIDVISPINFEIIDGIKTILVTVEDADGVFEVDFSLDGEKLGTFNEVPYQLDVQFDALAPGTHELLIEARDVFGSEAVERISVEAKNPDIIAPDVKITSPENQKEYCNSVSVEYEVEDDFSIRTCTLSLNDKSIAKPMCESVEILETTATFYAKAHIPLNEEKEIITSTDQKSLIGTLVGTSWHMDEERTSLHFDGLEDYVDFSVANLGINNDVTVSFWLNPYTDEGMLMSQDWGYIGYEFGWAISLGANNHENNNALAITWSSGTNTKNLNGGNVIQTPSHSISLEQWQHVVVRKQNKQVDIFINGTLVTSELLIDGNISWPLNSDKQYTLAKAMNHPDMYNKNFHGLLDDIAIWTEALADDEIITLYQEEHNDEMQHLTVVAKDKAGNTGTSSVDFFFKPCINQ